MCMHCKTAITYDHSDRLMFVVGATQDEYLAQVRALVPHAFLLVPGVGAQGGDLAAVCRHGMNESVGLLVNSSRAIIYASQGHDFAQAAANAAQQMQQQMHQILTERGSR